MQDLRTLLLVGVLVAPDEKGVLLLNKFDLVRGEAREGHGDTVVVFAGPLDVVGWPVRRGFGTCRLVQHVEQPVAIAIAFSSALSIYKPRPVFGEDVTSSLAILILVVFIIYNYPVDFLSVWFTRLASSRLRGRMGLLKGLGLLFLDLISKIMLAILIAVIDMIAIGFIGSKF